MTRANLVDDYYSWLVSMVNDDDEFNCDNYSNVLDKLFTEEFYWTMEMDENRANDGIELRVRYCNEAGVPIRSMREAMPEYCTIFEMMVALAIRIEDEIMSNTNYGDRTSKWFWTMMKNCELANLDDGNYYDEDADEVIYCLLNRQYLRDGYGGLFTTLDHSINMRNVEIWYQMNYYFSDFFALGNE